MAASAPKQLRLAADKRSLIVVWPDHAHEFRAEYLRVCSPSAEIRGHGGDWQIVGGKREVSIQRVEPVGRYAVRLVFSDGHDSGIYSWDGLAELEAQEARWWPRYLERLQGYGMSRDAADNVVPLNALKPQGGAERN
nr:DUF971 domain-containing protein [Oceanococcus sp. HetDA_MAG_MS8]